MSGMLDQKTAFVTAAGAGIGLAAAHRFAGHGASVAIVDRDGSAAKAAAEAINTDGGDAIAITCDVSIEADVRRAVDATIDRWGRIDCAFNNAGFGNREARLADLELMDWKAVIDVDLLGTFLCMKYQIPHMIAAGGGAIVNTASNAGKAAVPLLAPYGAAKAGVINMSQTTAVEYARDNIRVNAICPGMILTPPVRRMLGENSEMLSLLQIPMERAGEDYEIGEMAAWLLSPLSSYVTGQAYSVDGGMSACQ